MKKRPDGRYCKKLTINGKQVSFYGKSEKEILEKILNYKKKEANGKTFAEVADEWENKHYSTLEYQTALRYRSLTKHATTYFQGKYVKDITSKDVENYLNHYADKNYSTKSLKDQLSVLSMILRYACINQYILTNPAQYVPVPKGKKAVKRNALKDAEIKAICENKNCEMGRLAYFLLYTGLRKGEALALQYKDIDFENKTITINKTLYFDSNKPVIKTSVKTDAGERIVVLTDNVVKVLGKGKKNDIVFGVDGNYYTNSYFTRHWKKYCEQIDFHIIPHQLRHTYATLLYEAEIDVKTAQNLLGHADISTTQNIYTHIRQNQLEKVKINLNTFFKDNEKNL